MYKYYQPNEQDLKDQQPDCVIRALTKVLDVTWLEAFESLIPYARKLQTTLTCIQCYEKYLFDAGFKYVGISNRKGSKRPTVKSFSASHKKGTYFLNLANHTVAVIDGIYYDTWDCGDSFLYGYYAILEDK